jgi:rhodanese-related sulfurtransferase
MSIGMSIRRAADRAPAPVHHLMRRHALVAVLSVGLMAGGAWADPVQSDVTLGQARAEAQAGRAVLIDIREPHEHAKGVAAGAVLLPMSQIGQRLAEIPADPSRPVLLICNTQNRSSATVRALRDRPGYGHVRFVQGGMSEWAKRGWPMVMPTR